MNELSKALLMIHVVAGFTSLVLFWIPVIVKKGSTIHNKVGMWYVYMMTVVVLSSALLSIENLCQGLYQTAAFLGYLAVLTGYPLWHGMSIFKCKKNKSDTFILILRTFNWSLLIGATGLLFYAYILNFQGSSVLMIIFALLGLPSIATLRLSKEKIRSNNNWLFYHLQGMIVSGIAAYTAFFAFGGRTFFGNIFTGYWMIIPWVMPTVIGVVVIQLMKKKYLKKG